MDIYLLYVNQKKTPVEISVRITKCFMIIEFTDEYGAGIGEWYNKGDKLKCKLDNKGKHNIKDWGDDSYTIYPNRQGIPYYIKKF